MKKTKKKPSPFKVKSSRRSSAARPAAPSREKASSTPSFTEAYIKRAKYLIARLDDVKLLYNELERITLALVDVPSSELAQYGVAIVDNYEAKNVQFKTVAMRRYELKWLGRK